VLATVVAVTGLVVVLVGVAPRSPLARRARAALGGSREGAGGRTIDRRARRVLVGAQVALALVVLAAASLVGRSLAHLTALDLGIPAVERLALVELVPPAGTFVDRRPPSAGGPASTRSWGACAPRGRAGRRAGGEDAVLGHGRVGWAPRARGRGARRLGAATVLNLEVTGAEYLRATGVAARGRPLPSPTPTAPTRRASSC
jgi:hypothetical protein